PQAGQGGRLSADVVNLAAARRQRLLAASAPDVAQLPLVVQSHPGAVALHLPETEFWLSPEQARAIGEDLIRAAAEAEGDHG
ncbi:MAG TPA: hypothetical protein VGP93_17235, partial [Polyangiaceae bacterium]|nr:hypothetical protein [Polyangiaceae bacterium]